MTEISLLSDAMGLLRHRVHRELPLQHVALLLMVAENPGITMPELADYLKMPQGSLSRNVKLLSRYVERERGVAVLKGYNLLRTERFAYRSRVLSVYLTDEGEALILDLAGTLNPQQRRGAGHLRVVGRVPSEAGMAVAQ